MFQGVDVSSNNGAVNFSALKAAGRSFVMVRVGYGMHGSNGFYGYISQVFASQLQAAQAAGLETGVYWYSCALTPAEARVEAEACLQAIAPYQLTYPVAFDQEYQEGLNALSRQQRTDICKAFLDVAEQAGYYAILYASTNWFQQFLYDDQLTRYDHWVAQYAPKLTYQGPVGIWQYSGSGQIAGISGQIDLDIAYQDYPAVIRRAGLNHLKPAENAPESDGGETAPDGGETAPDGGETVPDGGETASDGGETSPDGIFSKVLELLQKLIPFLERLFSNR